MGRIMVRITIVAVAAYFIVSFVMQTFCNTCILEDWYVLPFEICVVVYAFGNGRYHCRNIRFLSLSIFACDFIMKTDKAFRYLPTETHGQAPLAIMALGMAAELTLAIMHFIKTVRENNGKR